MLEYFPVEKIETIRNFPVLFLFASIFKHLVRNLSRNSFCVEKDNVSTSFTLSGSCFLPDSFLLIELIFVTTHANLNYLGRGLQSILS